MKSCLRKSVGRQLPSAAPLGAFSPAAVHSAQSFAHPHWLGHRGWQRSWSKQGQFRAALPGKALNGNPGTGHWGKGEVKHLANWRRFRAGSSSSCLYINSSQEALAQHKKMTSPGYCSDEKGEGKNESNNSKSIMSGTLKNFPKII